MINAGANVKIDKFLFALRAKKAACQRTMPDILNNAARDVAFRASSFTTKTSPALIRSQLLRDPHLRYALTSLLLKRLGGKQLTANQVKYNTLNRLSRSKGLLGKGQFQKAVNAFVARRMASAAYLRSAYAQAIANLGGSFRGSQFKGTAEGFANKATISKLLAEIVTIVSEPDTSHAAGAERIGKVAIQKAIDFVADDMLAYAQRKLAVAAAT